GDDPLVVKTAREVPNHAVERRDEGQRQRHAHGRDSQDAREQVDPAGEPGVRLSGQILRPLEDRSGDRIMAREFREGQGDDELAQRDDRPTPEEDAADRRQTKEEERKDAGRRRDVAECDGERAEDAERATKLLLVAETREIGLVASGLARRLITDVHHVGCPPDRGRADLDREPRTCQSRRGTLGACRSVRPPRHASSFARVAAASSSGPERGAAAERSPSSRRPRRRPSGSSAESRPLKSRSTWPPASAGYPTSCSSRCAADGTSTSRPTGTAAPTSSEAPWRIWAPPLSGRDARNAPLRTRGSRSRAPRSLAE